MERQPAPPALVAKEGREGGRDGGNSLGLLKPSKSITEPEDGDFISPTWSIVSKGFEATSGSSLVSLAAISTRSGCKFLT